MSIYRTMRLVAVRDETPGCKSFFLEPEDGRPLEYRAGQFLTFAFFNAAGEQRRSYSIVSAPGKPGPLMITVRRIDNGEFSRFLFEKLTVGDTLLCTGTAGFFVLPADSTVARQYFLFAAGTGITPMLPMIELVLTADPEKHVTLIYSNRSIDSTLFFDQLNALRDKYAHRFVIEYLFSTDKNLARARLNKERIVELLNADRKFTIDRLLFYVCGPFDYMRMVKIALLEMGMHSSQVRMEDFDPMPPNAGPEPPDKDSHLVSIQIDDQRFQFYSQYPDTILQSARRNMIALPYSCEAGRCGSCAAICKAGRIWMRYNEVLLDEELKEGKVLTCTGFAVGGDVSLAIGTK